MLPHACERLMLDLLRAPERATEPLPEVPASAFVDLCRRHRVAGMIGPRLNAAVPGGGEIRSGLQEIARKTLVDNLVLLQALRDVAALLREARVRFVLLKGSSLLHFLYRRVDERPMTDVDLLIRKEDWPIVARALRARGYAMPSEAEERDHAENWYNQSVASPAVPSTSMEFHWNLESIERSRIDLEELLREAVPCEVEGDPYLRLGDDHLLLHLAVHLAHHYEAPAVMWVEDLRRLLAKGRFDWEKIARLAALWRVRNGLAYSFAYVEKAFPGTLPEEARRFRLSPLRRLLLSAFRTDDPALPHIPLEGNPLRHVVSMVLLDRWRDVVRYTVVHAGQRAARARNPGREPERHP